MADLERIYRSLRLIRRAEEEVARVYPSDKIKSPVHLSIGQESIAVGVCDALRHDDIVSGTYRGHAAYLAKGAPLDRMMAELYGKDTGCARGKGGSMHLVDMAQGVLGASAVVGTTIPLAAGFALALKREGKGRVAVSFFGDGATEEGVFAESLNFAALHRLPLLFVCENNGYAIHEPTAKRWATNRLVERAASYGMPAEAVNDGDVLALRALVIRLVEGMRAGTGPAFVEAKTYRWREHVGPNEDFEAGYRGRRDLEAWQATDQVVRIGGMIAPARRAAIDAAIETEIAAALQFAENSPVPDPAQLTTDTYA